MHTRFQVEKLFCQPILSATDFTWFKLLDTRDSAHYKDKQSDLGNVGVCVWGGSVYMYVHVPFIVSVVYRWMIHHFKA